MCEDRVPRWVPFGVIGLAVVLIALIPCWLVTLPYYAYSAGPVGDALDAIEVVDGVGVYPPEGELFYLTVAVQEINVFELMVALFDPSVDLVRREYIRQEGETQEDVRRRSLLQMDAAKETAIALALERIEGDDLFLSDGIEVVELTRDDAADSTLLVGDVIQEIDGTEVRFAGDVREAVGSKGPDETVEITVLRGDRELTIRVTLVENPEVPGQAILGVFAKTLNARFPVDIESANLGGPSAGMMYTLAIIDKLTEGELTKGNVVAGTGTIDDAGNVGPIGGVRQKVVAAEAAGATLMLVPEANYAEALTAPRQDMELASVKNLDEAIQILDNLEPAA